MKLKTFIWQTISGKRIRLPYEQPDYMTRRVRHAGKDVVKIRKRRAKNKLGRKQRRVNRLRAK